MHFSDKQILKEIHNGNDKVFEHLYKEIFHKVKKYITRNSGGEDEARDIFQDAILIFYKHVKTGKYKEGHDIHGFIYSVSRNLWINRSRRENRTELLNDNTKVSAYAASAIDDLITREREEFVQRMFKQLGDGCRELLVNTLFHKFSMKEIKEKMGFSSENVAKTKHYKCKQRLIELYKQNLHVKEMLQE